MDPGNDGVITRGKPFKAGNPGRPKGARNKATVAAEALLDGEAEQLTRTCIDLAKQGDLAALRLCLDRILPPRKGRPISFDLPKISKASDLLKALYEVISSVSKGDLSPEEAHAVGSLLEQARRSQEVVDIEERVLKLEERSLQGG